MNKNLKEKFKNLVRKEGFYIALFLCLCIIVTVGTISYKMISDKNEVNKKNKLKIEKYIKNLGKILSKTNMNLTSH